MLRSLQTQIRPERSFNMPWIAVVRKTGLLRGVVADAARL